ncbi:hypothetical protein KIL84_004759 [Mauremys mutica]|uniref:Uncharacterized protein n=1 Tax=Mauremys mutica TaxID=74926 RepID=A0A9D4B0B1_9SAUR|nr:hypothetical protein KIL84_004759 [Mauremys mutica]
MNMTTQWGPSYWLKLRLKISTSSCCLIFCLEIPTRRFLKAHLGQNSISLLFDPLGEVPPVPNSAIPSMPLSRLFFSVYVPRAPALNVPSDASPSPSLEEIIPRSVTQENNEVLR